MSNTGKIAGKDCRIYFNTSLMGGAANFQVPGMGYNILDTTDMGYVAETFMLGIANGGEISFSGQCKQTDAVQLFLESANQNGTFLTSLYFTMGDGPTTGTGAVSYYGPATDGSGCYITAYSPMKADKGGMVTFDGKAKVSGHYLRR